MSDKPKGIFGWLLLPAVITCLTPIIFGTMAYNLFFQLDTVWSIRGKLATFQLVVIVLEIIGQLGLSVLSLACVYFLATRSPRYPILSTAFVFSFLALGITDTTVSALYFGESVTQEQMLTMLIAAGMAVSCWLYMKRSERVKNTFQYPGPN